MNETEKLLKKLSVGVRRQIEQVLLAIYAGKLEGLDIKKLTGSKNIYRVRVGRYRIIYRQSNGRNEKTYKDL